MEAASTKTVLITGANRGIGFETARQLLARGCRVILGIRNPAAAQHAVSELSKGGGKVSALALDVSNSASVHAAAAAFGETSDRLDVLINNAGIYPDEGLSIGTVSREQMVATFQTNTFGPIEVIQQFLPFLRKSSGARIINVSSGYGQIEGLSATVPSYCLSKLTLNGVTLMFAEALRSDRIAVNSMCPGWVRTDMGGPNATRSVEQGADTAVWLATEAPQEVSGKFFRDRREIAW